MAAGKAFGIMLLTIGLVALAIFGTYFIVFDSYFIRPFNINIHNVDETGRDVYMEVVQTMDEVYEIKNQDYVEAGVKDGYTIQTAYDEGMTENLLMYTVNADILNKLTDLYIFSTAIHTQHSVYSLKITNTSPDVYYIFISPQGIPASVKSIGKSNTSINLFTYIGQTLAFGTEDSYTSAPFNYTSQSTDVKEIYILSTGIVTFNPMSS